MRFIEGASKAGYTLMAVEAGREVLLKTWAKRPSKLKRLWARLVLRWRVRWSGR